MNSHSRVEIHYLRRTPRHYQVRLWHCVPDEPREHNPWPRGVEFVPSSRRFTLGGALRLARRLLRPEEAGDVVWVSPEPAPAPRPIKPDRTMVGFGG